MTTKKPQNIEYETKVLGIDPEEIRNKLRELGAKEFPENFMRRYVFDFNPMSKENIRLRDNGDGRVTLTYKKRNNYGVDGTEELEIEVSDFDTTAEIFKRLDIKNVYYQENKRQIFTLDGIEFSIDTWPNLDPHLEVEGKSVADVKRGLKLLGLEGGEIGNVPVWEIYMEKGVDIHTLEKLEF